ncbi:protein kinase domain-containing protein [Methylobacterium sp. WCS2018Hpa-22]|uniref:serine/threonine protein kinase n=1 Tax=Methylobacterium sp. WCS2018Hpa-22 TaxID=3073633 RepID=UPI00288A5AA8|nr:protein kinase [Methylobacterium sp. WCS2018Hpa-22]
MPYEITALPASLQSTAARLGESITFSDSIEKGANGHVLIGHHRLLGRAVVVKFYYWGDGVHIEPAMLARLESTHVLKVDYAEAIDEEDAFFITRYCSRGDLDDELATRSFGPVEAIDALLQFGAGVSYLHGEGYVHRDLKPSNLFVTDEGHRVIGDFGSVVQIGGEDFANSLSKHSIIYRPPEDFVGNRFYRQGDIYQLGMVLYQLLGGDLPYEIESWLTPRQIAEGATMDWSARNAFYNSAIEARICRGRVLNLDSLQDYVPDLLKRVIRKACHLDKGSRYPTAADLLATLNNIRRRVFDWRIDDDVLTLRDRNRTYRIIQFGGHFHVEKQVASGWRRQRGLTSETRADAIASVQRIIG